MTESTTQRVQGYCALCWSSCGCISVVEDGRLIAVEPDPSHPTGKVLCAKGKAAPELVHHDDRLLYPMKRTNPKGDPDPGWQRISWDEALETTAAAMNRLAEESGRESVAFGITTPAGTAMQDGFQWIERLRSAFGSPNLVASAEVCDFHVHALNTYTFGGALPNPDLANSDCVVLWGHNSSMTWIAHGTRVAEARARGAKLVVIDPRRVGMAAKADQWLRVRPGSDGALALGLAGIMIDNGWFDREFVCDWTNGPFLVHEETGRFLTGADLATTESAGDDDPTALRVAWDTTENQAVLYDPAKGAYQIPKADLALTGSYEVNGIMCRPAFNHYAELCRQYSPERVEEITWVPASQLRETAELLGNSGPVALSCWAGLEQHTNAAQTSRAIALLYTLTGSYDTKGGNVIFETIPMGNVMGAELMEPSQREKALGAKSRPLGPESMGYVTAENFYDSVLTHEPYPIRGFVNFGPNVLLSHADGARGAEALTKLDFMVHADIFMTPTAAYADIVLPINTPWEREGLRADFNVDQEAIGHIQLRPQVVEARGESRSDTWTAFALAKHLGLGHLFWDGDIDASYQVLLEPSGLDLNALRETRGGVSVPLKTRYRKFAGDGDDSPGFNTPSRKIELFSQLFLDHGYPPLPEYIEPMMGPVARPDLVDRFPLVLTSAKSPRYLQSQLRGVAKLRRTEPDPRIEIHPDTAGARGIADGDWMVLSTLHGRMRGKAHFSKHLDPRVISATHGWWQACEALSQPSYDAESNSGANLNGVIGNDACDPTTGSVPLKSYLCQVEPVTNS